MAQGYHDWVPGEAVSAANLEDYCQNQSVMRFSTSTARDTDLASVKTEGMVTYQTDNNDLDIYNGSTFSTLIAPAHGAWTAWTPVVTQSNTPTLTATGSAYMRIGRLIIARVIIAITSSGTAANDIVVSLPVTAQGGSTTYNAGPLTVEDASASTRYHGHAIMASSTTVKISQDGTPATSSWYGSATMTAALASGDFIYGMFMYEASADA